MEGETPILISLCIRLLLVLSLTAEMHLRPRQTSMMQLLSENSGQLKAVSYFLKKLPLRCSWMRWNGDKTSKSKLFSKLVPAVAVVKRYVEFLIYKCWRIFEVISQLTSVILYHMQKRKLMELNGKSAWNGFGWFNLGFGSDQVALKSQVSL